MGEKDCGVSECGEGGEGEQSQLFQGRHREPEREKWMMDMKIVSGRRYSLVCRLCATIVVAGSAKQETAKRPIMTAVASGLGEFNVRASSVFLFG